MVWYRDKPSHGRMLLSRRENQGSSVNNGATTHRQGHAQTGKESGDLMSKHLVELAQKSLQCPEKQSIKSLYEQTALVSTHVKWSAYLQTTFNNVPWASRDENGNKINILMKNDTVSARKVAKERGGKSQQHGVKSLQVWAAKDKAWIFCGRQSKGHELSHGEVKFPSQGS